MAALKKRGRIWWVKIYSNGKHIEESLGTDDLREARKQAKLIEARHTVGVQ